MISSCGWSRENKGTSWVSFPALPPRTPHWGDGSGALCGGKWLRTKRPSSSPSAPPGPYGGDSLSYCQPTQKQGWGLGFPSLQPSSPASGLQSPGTLTTLVGGPAVPCPHGAVLEEGQAAPQSVPVVLCWHRRPAGPPHPGHTRWHARCTCTWGKNIGQGVCNWGGASTGRG